MERTNQKRQEKRHQPNHQKIPLLQHKKEGKQSRNQKKKPISSMSRSQIEKELQQSRKQKQKAEKQGKGCIQWIKNLSSGIHINSRATVNQIITRDIHALPSSLQSSISSVSNEMLADELDTDDETQQQRVQNQRNNRNNSNNKWSWKKKLLIFLGIVILIVACYYLGQGGFFSDIVVQLKKFVFPYMKELLMSCACWIKDICINGWNYLF